MKKRRAIGIACAIVFLVPLTVMYTRAALGADGTPGVMLIVSAVIGIGVGVAIVKTFW